MLIDIKDIKRDQLEKVAYHREQLRIVPKLRWLFFEITNRCNLNCKHCGSSCSSKGDALTVEDVESTLQTLKHDNPMICLTGGEPLMHPKFFEISNRVHTMGFNWGMTTNGTLIDENVALELKRTGMGTVSVSLDGLEASHDSLRQREGAWKDAVRGIEALKSVGFEPQVTTVLHRQNFNDIESLYSFLCEMGITNWRPINVEPIGRACESNELLLSPRQLDYLLSFIRNKRFDRSCNMNVTFGCSHYLGVDMERMVRDHYFLCSAGILTASVRSNGDICACLDIVNKPELVQGNIQKDDFWDVWKNKFQVFRSDRTVTSTKCLSCSERFVCNGDSAHTWDYEKNQPLLCYRDFGSALNDNP